ncbi:MAG: hypothetical protein F6K21_05605 [Symploca sp. SIO2D2]|nr:hypothetical protein [Symploca sp. SIO2D2]
MKNKTYRTLINIASITSDSGEKVAEAFVPSWNPHSTVCLPTSQIPSELILTVESRLEQKEEVWLFAHVNIGAEKADELEFTRFESAPRLDCNDGLA